MEKGCRHVAADDAAELERVPVARVGMCSAPEALSLWGQVAPWLEAALGHAVQRELGLEDLREGLASGFYRLLIMGDRRGAVRACAIVSIRVHDGGERKYLSLIAAGGSALDEWLVQLVDACKDIARSAGCDEILAMGRPGWVRVLKPHGLEHRASVMRLAL